MNRAMLNAASRRWGGVGEGLGTGVGGGSQVINRAIANTHYGGVLERSSRSDGTLCLPNSVYPSPERPPGRGGEGADAD